jgi:site-specific DNA-methyltransferase (adenine-specific)
MPALYDFCHSTNQPEAQFEDWMLRKIKTKRVDGEFQSSTIPYTPLSLIKEIFNNIEPIKNRCLNTKIGVLYTVEMAAYLGFLGFTDVIVITREWDDKISNAAGLLGYKYMPEDDVVKQGKKFDVIVGNPPYQAELKTLQDRLWMQFVDKSFELVADGGIVSLITPSNWAVTTELYEKWFVSHKVLAINMNECGRYFPNIAIPFSYYVIQNSPSCGSDTLFITDIGKFKAVLPVTPIGTIPHAISIYDKVLRTNLPTLTQACAPQTHYSYRKAGKVVDEPTDTYKYKVLVSPATSKKAEQWVWGKVVCPKQVGPRVIGYTYPGSWKNLVVSCDVQTTHGFIHIPVPTIEDAQSLKLVLASKLFLFLVKSMNSSRSIKVNTIQRLPLMDLSKIWTDQELYQHFNLTQDEINLIEGTIK